MWADMVVPTGVAALKSVRQIAFLLANNPAVPVDFGGQIELFFKDSDSIIIRLK